MFAMVIFEGAGVPGAMSHICSTKGIAGTVNILIVSYTTDYTFS